VLMHMSNFRPVKRAGIVFDVFARLRARMRATLVYVGDGPERAAIEARAQASPYADDVIFEGEQPDPVPMLSCADVFLLPSALESFGMAALEAMACEVPVIASRVGGLPELIDDGRTGFLCALDDVDAMTDRASRLISDPELGARMGRAGAASVAERFCTDRIVPMYEALYQRVMA
jgi:L-malate glycosyltransferase